MKITDKMVAEWRAQKDTEIHEAFADSHWYWLARRWQTTETGSTKFAAIRKAIRAEAKEKKDG